MKKIIFFFVLLSLGVDASESANSLLLYKLVKKGVISDEEAQVIAQQTQEETKTLLSSANSTWVNNLKPWGDFRLRYQRDEAVNVHPDQQRLRIRLRGGIEPKITEQIKVGVGLATGLNTNTEANLANKDTSRSTNQTLGDGFSKKPISLDLAYAEYSPLSWLSLSAGKFKNPVWEPSDLIWDTDINPEGLAVKLKGKASPDVELFGTTDIFTLDERSGESDPLMYVLQAGIKHKIVEKMSYKLALSFYGFTDLKGKKLDGSSLSNSTDADSKLIYDYKNFVAAFELNFKEPFGAWLPYVAPFLEYVNNYNTLVSGNHRDGYMVGIVVGDEKLSRLSDWQLKYNYARLGKDAVLDIFPDSDRYGGKTNIKAHEVVLSYALGSSNWLALDFYYGERLSSNKMPATVLQLDWNLRF